MPHLTYCGYYFRIASDELWLPGFCAIFGRIFWTAFLVVSIIVASYHLNHCSDGWLMLLYLSISIIIFFLSIVCEAVIIRVSVKGTMVENQTRDTQLPPLLSVHIFLGFLQFCAAVFGCFVISGSSFVPCSASFSHSHVDIEMIFLSIVVISQLLDVLSVLCCCLVFSTSNTTDESPVPRDSMIAVNTWESRCKLLCKSIQICSCNIFGGSKIGDDLEDLAKVLTVFFHHEGFLDVVASDVVAGIILVRMEQVHAHRERHGRGVASPNSPALELTNSAALPSDSYTDMEAGLGGRGGGGKVVDMDAKKRRQAAARDPGLDIEDILFDEMDEVRVLKSSSPEDRQLVSDLAKYAVFGLAAYSHLLALYMQPVTGTCGLCFTRMRHVNRCGAPSTGAAAGGRGGSGLCCCLPSNRGDSHCEHLLTTEDAHTRESHCCRCCCCCRLFRDPVGHNLAIQAPQSSGLHDLPSRVVGDNCVSVNETGMLHITKNRNKAQLIFASFRNDTFVKPYAIFMDNESNTVIVVVRGTLSLEDCVTDALCEAQEMTEAGERWGFDGSRMKAHSGMLRSAMKIREELETFGYLARAMNSLTGPQLMLVGHSLGAGTAVLLTFMLKPAYPNARCMSYGTPGSVVDPDTARACSSYVTSCVLGHDLVSRLSMRALLKLREHVFDCMSRAKVSKMKIMQAIFREFSPDDFLFPKGHAPDSEFKRNVDVIQDRLNAKISGLSFSDLVIPGRVIHYQRLPAPTTSSSLFCCASRPNNNSSSSSSLCDSSSPPQYRAVEGHIDSFRELSVSPSMAWEHLPDQYLNHLSALHNHWEKQT